MKTFTKQDIIKHGVLNKENLLILCTRINDNASWDKVGVDFYKIDPTKKFFYNDEASTDVKLISGWLDYLGSLKATLENVGYSNFPTFWLETNQYSGEINTILKLEHAFAVLTDMGYKLENIVNPSSAYAGRDIFGTYLEFDGNIKLLDWLQEKGIKTKTYRKDA